MVSPNVNKKQINLIIAADEPALFFSSTAAAAQYLEAEDVRSGTYPEAYGPDGQPFDIVSDRFDQIIITRRGDLDPCPIRLKEIIECFLVACNVSFSKDMTLEYLIELCVPYVDDGM